MTKLFAWDLHGVLETGNKRNVLETCRKVLEEFGIRREICMEEVSSLYGLSYLEYFRHLIPGASEEEIHRMNRRSLEIAEENARKHARPTPHAKKVLEKIKKSGHENVVFSNSRPEHIELFLQIIGLEELVDDYVGVPKKHERNGFCIKSYKGKQIRRYSVENGFSEIVVIGDRETDISAGKEAGARTYLYTDRSDGCGETEADRVIDDLREVLKEI